MDIQERKQQILDAALNEAIASDYNMITYSGVAKAAEVSRALVQFHYNSMAKLRRAVLEEAIRRRSYPVIASGMVRQEPLIIKAPEDIRLGALNFIRKRCLN